MKHIFILKPTQEKQFIDGIVNIMKGYQYQIRYTKNIDDAYEISKEYQSNEEICRLYAVGGDGFVHKVANGIVGSNNELVVIPNGTGNDYARNIYDNLDPLEVLRKSLTLSSKGVDLIKVNDVYCINVICCGLDAQVANAVNERSDVRYVPKSLQYGYSILKRVLKLRFYQTNIKQYGETVFDGDVVICAFCKGKYFGGGFMIGPGASLDDGYIDVNIIGDISKKQLPKYLKALYTHNLDKMDNYRHYRFKALDLVSTQRINIDGEILPVGTYHLEIAPKAIKLVCENT